MAEGRGAVVVTGASTGIGEACALRLDKLGFHVYAGVRRDADAEALKKQASERLQPLNIDVTQDASIRSAAETVTAAAGEKGLAGLVNNAGIGIGGPLEFLSLDDLRRQLEVNVIGQVAVTQAFLPLIRKGRGRVVFIGSIGGRMATPFMGPYCASKFAIEAIADALRMELRPWKINVALVEPGNITTPIWQKGQATVNRLEGELPAQAKSLYGSAMVTMREALGKFEGRGIPPDNVARAVAQALTSRRPKTRYLVGADARLQAVLADVVPDRIRDGLVRSQLGLKG